MADKQNPPQPTIDLASGAVLRPGRAADPLPGAVSAGGQVVLDATQARVQPGDASRLAGDVPEAEQPQVGDHPSDTASGQQESPEASAEEVSEADVVGDPEAAKAQASQRELRQMLRQCDRVLLLDFDQLSMNHWPDNYTLAIARRHRDLWVFSIVVAAVVFASGLTGIVPAWIAGAGFGAMAVLLMLGTPSIRRFISSRPSYLELLVTRRRMLREARAHAANLEGRDGLVWQCARMARYNPALANARFTPIIRASERRQLSHFLNRRDHVRLYLMYMLEAEKAYGRVQKAFFKGNQAAIDRGWQGVAAEPEPRA